MDMSVNQAVMAASRASADQINLKGLVSSDSASRDVNFLSEAAAVLLGFIDVVNRNGSKLLDDLRQKTATARTTQDMANRIDKLISDLNGGSGTAWVPEDVKDFMWKNGLMVDGKTIYEFAKGPLGTGDLRAVKAVLDNFAAKQTDVAQQANLELQKATTTLNFLNTGVSSLYSLVKDLNQTIYSKL